MSPILGRAVWVIFALVVFGPSLSIAYAYLFADSALQAERMARPWYGNWGMVSFAVAFFSAFVYVKYVNMSRGKRDDRRKPGLALNCALYNRGGYDD